MGSRIHAWVGGFLGLMLGIACGGAQTIAPDSGAIAQGSKDALHAMSQIAGVIFAGQVIAIRRHEAVNGGTGVVEIDFAVEDAIRGVAGNTYTLREWGGVWTAGYAPFAVGQRYLMLLHEPSAAGFSSPVGGSDGAIPIRGAGDTRAVGSVKAALAGAAAVVDLRWVATRATRTVGYRSEPVLRSTSLPVAMRAYAAEAGGGQVEASGPLTKDSAMAGDAAYTTVVGMLRSWKTGDDVAR